MAKMDDVGLGKGLTKVVLMSLGAGVIIGTALLFPGIGILYKEFKKEQWEKARKRGRLRDTIRRLETQKFISWKEKEGELILTLTEKGKRKVLKFNIDEMRIKTPRKWDGLFRIIVFDIPEKKREARDIFRKKLKNLGFYQMQKSVFVHRFECREEIDFLRHELEIAPFVNYIVAKEISRISSEKI
ncbi:MAG: CRISPR-associated endonuclease Cas2 [Candidatus Levybacteria bacterium]|nr:CRISPR-associated endonuclease Cas2 [Candidatus Levybacteria bacterium]